MKLLSKIRALFTHHTEGLVDMPLAAAEIKKNRVYLHPADNPRKTIRIVASAVDLRINPDGTVDGSNILTWKPSENAENKRKNEKNPKDGAVQKGPKRAREDAPYKEPMKTVSFRVYQEEYDALMNILSANGYRKAEYMLACIYAAKKNSLESMYQRYYEDHNQRRKAERAAAKQYREEQAKAALGKEP